MLKMDSAVSQKKKKKGAFLAPSTKVNQDSAVEPKHDAKNMKTCKVFSTASITSNEKSVKSDINSKGYPQSKEKVVKKKNAVLKMPEQSKNSDDTEIKQKKEPQISKAEKKVKAPKDKKENVVKEREQKTTNLKEGKSLTYSEYNDIFTAVLQWSASVVSDKKKSSSSTDKENKFYDSLDEHGDSNDEDDGKSYQVTAPTNTKDKQHESIKKKDKKFTQKKEIVNIVMSSDNPKEKSGPSKTKTSPKLADRKKSKAAMTKQLSQSSKSESSSSDSDSDSEGESGTWVQCSVMTCQKWRYVPDIADPSLVPEIWDCSMNSDTAHNSCECPQESYDESEHILTKYTPGSVVWAKMDGYPWWPAMIEDDPDYGIYFELKSEHSMNPTQYHVSFFDDHVTRAWTRTAWLAPYKNNPQPKTLSAKTGHKYKREIQKAVQNADKAMELDLQERLKQYGFASRFSKSQKKLKKLYESMMYSDDEFDFGDAYLTVRPRKRALEKKRSSTNLSPNKKFKKQEMKLAADAESSVADLPSDVPSDLGTDTEPEVPMETTAALPEVSARKCHTSGDSDSSESDSDNNDSDGSDNNGKKRDALHRKKHGDRVGGKIVSEETKDHSKSEAKKKGVCEEIKAKVSDSDMESDSNFSWEAEEQKAYEKLDKKKNKKKGKKASKKDMDMASKVEEKENIDIEAEEIKTQEETGYCDADVEAKVHMKKKGLNKGKKDKVAGNNDKRKVENEKESEILLGSKERDEEGVAHDKTYHQKTGDKKWKKEKDTKVKEKTSTEEHKHLKENDTSDGSDDSDEDRTDQEKKNVEQPRNSSDFDNKQGKSQKADTQKKIVDCTATDSKTERKKKKNVKPKEEKDTKTEEEEKAIGEEKFQKFKTQVEEDGGAVNGEIENIKNKKSARKLNKMKDTEEREDEKSEEEVTQENNDDVESPQLKKFRKKNFSIAFKQEKDSVVDLKMNAKEDKPKEDTEEEKDICTQQTVSVETKKSVKRSKKEKDNDIEETINKKSKSCEPEVENVTNESVEKPKTKKGKASDKRSDMVDAKSEAPQKAKYARAIPFKLTTNDVTKAEEKTKEGDNLCGTASPLSDKGKTDSSVTDTKKKSKLSLKKKEKVDDFEQKEVTERERRDEEEKSGASQEEIILSSKAYQEDDNKNRKKTKKQKNVKEVNTVNENMSSQPKDKNMNQKEEKNSQKQMSTKKHKHLEEIQAKAAESVSEKKVKKKKAFVLPVHSQERTYNGDKTTDREVPSQKNGREHKKKKLLLKSSTEADHSVPDIVGELSKDDGDLKEEDDNDSVIPSPKCSKFVRDDGDDEEEEEELDLNLEEERSSQKQSQGKTSSKKKSSKNISSSLDSEEEDFDLDIKATNSNKAGMRSNKDKVLTETISREESEEEELDLEEENPKTLTLRSLPTSEKIGGISKVESDDEILDLEETPAQSMAASHKQRFSDCSDESEGEELDLGEVKGEKVLVQAVPGSQNSPHILGRFRNTCIANGSPDSDFMGAIED